MTFTTPPTVVGADFGNGNTAIAVRNDDGKIVVHSIQTSVARLPYTDAPAKGKGGKAKGKAAQGSELASDFAEAGLEAISVSFDGHHFATGPGSWYRGVPETSILLNLLYGTPERLALLYALLAKTLRPGTSPEANPLMVVIGLPTNLNKEQLAASKANLTGLKRDHRFTVQGRDYACSIVGIKVIPQPVGAYLRYCMDDTANFIPDRAAGDVFVLDIGFGTTCGTGLTANGGQVNIVPAQTFGDVNGVWTMVKTMAAQRGIDVAAMDAELRAKSFRNVPDDVKASLLNAVQSNLRDRKITNLRQFNAVLAVGGGTNVLGDMWKYHLMSMNAKLGDVDPLTGNVQGFLLFGEQQQRGK